MIFIQKACLKTHSPESAKIQNLVSTFILRVEV